MTISGPDGLLSSYRGQGAHHKDAIEEHFLSYASEPGSHMSEAPWMDGFGALSDLSDENTPVLHVIEQESETISAEDVA